MTHPNAFRMEAQEKREKAKMMLSEADELDRKAAELSSEPLPEADSSSSEELERDQHTEPEDGAEGAKQGSTEKAPKKPRRKKKH